jgi:type IV secretory pathway VirB10-like protein
MTDELGPEQEPGQGAETSPEATGAAPDEAGRTTDGEAGREPEGAAAPDEPTPDEPEPTGVADRSRRSTLLILAAAVVVLAAIGVGIYLVASSGDDDVANDPDQPTITDVKPSDQPSEPPLSDPATPAASATLTGPTKRVPPPANPNVAAARTTAEQATTAINKRDVAAMKKLSCDPSTIGSVEAFPPEATARLAQNPQLTGDKATAQIELSISGSEPTTVPLQLEKRGGKWCVP